MLHSMTGFARQTADSALGTLTCELRAVNHRYLDVQFRLPEEIRPKETELRQQVAAELNRGKVECSIHFRRSANAGADLRLNDALVKRIAEHACEISELLPQPTALNPIDVLRWPGVIEEPEIDTDPLYREASGLLGETLGSLRQMRASEGKRIKTMLEDRLGEIGKIAENVRERMPQVLDAVRTRQRERLEKLGLEADPGRLETELALIAQKLDVDEELDRLISHVAEIRDAMRARKPVGRRLDFLMQELNREANTLGSKSADTETTTAAVELKVLIEQMREQIQNVE